MSTTATATAKGGVTGNIMSNSTEAGKTVMAPFGHALVAAGEKNSRIVGLSADLAKYTDINVFRDKFPERFFQIGMAEQNAVGVAAGLARTGFVPFLTTYCVFATRRAYDFMAIDAALSRSNVKIIAGLPGLTTGYGGTHQGIEDLALMRAMPNMTVIDPCDATEVAQATQVIADYDGPVYMRLLRGVVATVLDPQTYSFKLGKAKLLRNGTDVAIISTGLMTGRALEAADLLAQKGIAASVLHVGTVKPFDSAAVLELLARVPRVVTAENHVTHGGLGSAVADAVADEGMAIKLRRVGIPNCFCESGSLPYLAEHYRMRGVDIAEQAEGLVGKS